MELQEIVERYAEAIEEVDAGAPLGGQNPRTKDTYAPSFKSLSETKAVPEIDAAWDLLHPGEFKTPALERVSVKYPAVKRAKCDHVFSVDDAPDGQEEWGIEVKKIEFIGNNGKRNDFGVSKMLSPYLKDRGLLHDAVRLREYGFTKRVAVIGYAFDYDEDSCAQAEALHGPSETIANMRQVLRDNGGTLRARPLIEFTDAILGLRGYLRGPRAQEYFSAPRSPTGGPGTVFGFEIRRPSLEPDFDPRHPW